MTTAPNVARPWLFGPVPDLLFGCGAGYVVVVAILAAIGVGMDQLRGWLPFAILVTGLPHYGATLERVLSTPEARQRYGGYALLFGVLVWGAFVATLVTGKGATWLVTIYLTWSPWHYAAQNFGLTMMFLRRAQANVTNLHRLLLKASFVLSFALVFLNIHRATSSSVQDPLYAASAARDAVRFAPLGIPERFASLGLVIAGVAYAGVTIAALVLAWRKSPREGRLPVFALVSSQGVWFVLPILLTWFVPTLAGSNGPAALAFIWVAIAHSVQYLWISMHFARVSGRVQANARSVLRYLSMAIFAGAAVWVFPVLLSAKGGLSKLPHESGLDMIVAAVVNLHHFLLDGVIWKLRDAPVKHALVDGRGMSIQDKPVSWPSRMALGIVGSVAVFCWIVAAWEMEVGRRRALARGDITRLEMAASRLALIGRDGPYIHHTLGRLLHGRGDSAGALARFEKSLALWPTAPAWIGIGKIRESERQWEAARDAFESALKLEPNNATALDNLARVLAAQGKLVDAVQAQYRAVLAAPDRPELRRRYDELLRRVPEAADEAAEEIVIRAP